jgi:hypothetical protein
MGFFRLAEEGGPATRAKVRATAASKAPAQRLVAARATSRTAKADVDEDSFTSF